MRIHVLLAFGSLLFLLVAGVPAAKADFITLPDIEYYVNLNTCCSSGSTVTMSGSGPGSFMLNCAEPNAASICGQADLSISPTTSVSVTATAYAGQNSQSAAEIAYYYEVVETGPGASDTLGTTLIPLVVSTYVSFTDSIGPGTSIGGNQQNGAVTTVVGNFQNGGNTVSRVYSTPQIPANSYDVYVNALAYYANPITLYVTTSLYNSTDTVSSVTGFADPIISFAPGFDATGYSILVSPGIPNGQDTGSTAPEPATFLLTAGAAILVLRGRTSMALAFCSSFCDMKSYTLSGDAKSSVDCSGGRGVGRNGCGAKTVSGSEIEDVNRQTGRRVLPASDQPTPTALG